MNHKKTSMILVAASLVLSMQSCSDKDLNAPREERFEIHALADCSDSPLEEFCVDVKAGVTELYVRTSVPEFDVFWQDAAPAPWVSGLSWTQTGHPEVWKVTFSHAARSENVLYTRRSGTLTFSRPEDNLGFFLPVHQGAILRTSDDFSDFKYGSWSPLNTDGDVHVTEWPDNLKKKGFESMAVSPAAEPSCFAKYGLLRIGDDKGTKGSLLTPVNSLHRYDSLLMVTFRAAAHPSDIKEFKVEVIGGGVIRDHAGDNGTSLTLEAPYIIDDAVTASGMWPDESAFIVFIAGTSTSPVGVNTRLCITSGASAGENEDNSRLYIDDFCVMKLVDGVDLDYYSINQGSGVDRILAARNNGMNNETNE